MTSTRTLPWRAVAALVMAVAMALAVIAPSTAIAQETNIPDEEPTESDRVSGLTRYDTAAEIALDGWGAAGTSVAIVATGEDYPDALSANYLAGQLDENEGGPVLLTGFGFVPESTSAALAELGVERVLLMGGTQAINAEVEQELAADYEVERISGATRFETAAQIAVSGDAVGELDDDRTVLLATGINWPDAMIGGTVSYAAEFPLLLTDRDNLHPASAEALDELQPDRVVILGGGAVISEGVEAELTAAGFTTERVNGGERTATAVAIAELAVDRLGFDLTRVNLATGANFPDTLTGGPSAGKLFSSPALLTQRGGLAPVPGDEALGAPTREFLVDNCSFEAAIRAFGGTEAIATDTAAAAEDAVNSCDFDF